ncbi:MAG: UvrB/UvrC motif-containing protein [Candidatus Omnitrophota bacterium]
MMKCDVCGVREATVHLTEVINEKVAKFHLCEERAREKSEEMQTHFGLTDLLSGLVDFVPSVAGDELGVNSGLECPVCGMTYKDFQKTGRLGCGKCYATFEKNLRALLRKIHGHDRHTGKMPFKGEEILKEQRDFQRLKKELDELIRAEEFEKAALVRDRIRDLEKNLEG